MAPKAVNAMEAFQPEQTLSRPWAAPTGRDASPHVIEATVLVGGAHGPESGGWKERIYGIERVRVRPREYDRKSPSKRKRVPFK